ncbi:SGNH/GDSL hydrolase family protein [Bacillus sp. FJAT-27445]|uniref:SGNH/GDSL hydrolase family protein n=1 Tax=Bacillus sp. FJAT-27445 TaxID=1679166 RepID=UPI000743EA8E|nr:SGNH/GDSL hydrolase family protein [Bacillus sp. FJAT-27445]
MKKTSIKMLIISMVLLSGLFGLINHITSAKEPPQGKEGFYEKIAHGKDFNYLVIGDSIGRGSGAEHPDGTWFALLEKQLKSAYGSAGDRHSIVQSGATAFEGIIKYRKEKPSGPVDLVFIVFGENDRKYMDASQFSFFYEQLIRSVKVDHPHAEIITFIESCLVDEAFAETISGISAHYGAINLDMRIPFKKSGLAPSMLTRDLVHPNRKGYELYSREIVKTLDSTLKSGKKTILPLPAPIHNGLSKEYFTIWHPIGFSGFVKTGNGYFSREQNSFIEYEFHGETVGYTVERGPEGGEVEVFIDGKSVGTVSTWWPFKRERNIYLAGSLSKGPHSIRFVQTGKTTNNGSQKTKPTVLIKAIIAEKGS